MTATLSNFHIIRPKTEMPQEQVLRWLAKAHAQADSQSDPSPFHTKIQERLFRLGLGPEKVQSRGIEIADCCHHDWTAMSIYNLAHNPKGYSLNERSSYFDQTVSAIFDQFYLNDACLPSHVIHVTCTGYTSPSGAQKLVSKKGGGAIVTHAYHMGCYASIPAIRMARGVKGTTDIVHTEICSLHLNPSLHDMEQLVVQSLFADGFIKYSVQENGHQGLAVLNILEEMIPESTHAMSWKIEEWGHKMTIGKDVPILIANALPGFVQKLTQGLCLKHDAFFAIHPGGPKVIEHVAKILNLEPWQYAASVDIMQKYGNMSSATLPHIWARLAQEVPDGANIVSLAYGPGLTVVGGVFVCRR